VSVITNIGFDHTQFLGNTLELIAKEKAGIIKPKTPVVVGETQRETQDVFKHIAKENKASIIFVDKTFPLECSSILFSKFFVQPT
jgi:dihydrofolate synthase/folylpolyglutamate synthase